MVSFDQISIIIPRELKEDDSSPSGPPSACSPLWWSSSSIISHDLLRQCFVSLMIPRWPRFRDCYKTMLGHVGISSNCMVVACSRHAWQSLPYYVVL